MKRADIQIAIKDQEWQSFRISLKGKSTKDKLKDLADYLNKGRTHNKEIQVQNYINALRRAGLTNNGIQSL